MKLRVTAPLLALLLVGAVACAAPTPTPRPTATPTATPLPAPTATATRAPTPTTAPTAAPTPNIQATVDASVQATLRAIPTATPTPTPAPTATPTPGPTATPTRTPTPTATPLPAGMTAYQNPTYGYSLLYPTGWTITQSNPALVTFTGPGSSSIVVNYERDATTDSLSAYKTAKVTAFQATVTGYTTISDTTDVKAATVKIQATYTQAAVAKRAYLFVDYPSPRGFFIVLSAAGADFAGIQSLFDQVLGSWQVPAIVK